MTKQIKFLSALVLGIATALVGIQVFLRYVFNYPLAWVEEVGRYLFIWSIFLGTVAAWVENRHIRITVLVDRLGSRANQLSKILGNILGLISFSYVAYFGYKIAYSNRATDFYTVPGMPRIVFYLAVPVCLTIMVIFILSHLKSQSSSRGADG